MRFPALLLITTALAACGGGSPQSAGTKPASPASTTAAPEIGSFGFDTTGMRRDIAPGDNFYTFANGHWDKVTPIPADRSNYGMFTKLDDVSSERTRIIIEEAAKQPGSKIGDLYASFVDEAAVNAKGMEPFKPYLTAIRAAKTRTDIARIAGQNLRDGLGGPFNLYVGVDDKDPDSPIVTLSQGGLSLPDRDYYLKADAKLAQVRTAFVAHATTMLTLAGEANAAARAQDLLAFETKIARAHWTQVESRDADKVYNKLSVTDLKKLAQGFDVDAYMAGAGIKVETLLVSQPSAIAGTAKVLGQASVRVLRDYILLHTLDEAAPYLSKPFVDEQFAFFGTVLSGTPQNRERWKRGVELVKGGMGEAVGQIYVERYFPPEQRPPPMHW